MIVPPSRAASASASADFPLQVGPATISALAGYAVTPVRSAWSLP